MTTRLETTASLLVRVRNGDHSAREQLCATYLPLMTRWAHGRLPAYARDLAETDDLVQISLLRALDYIETFEPRREGAFLAYLRKILLNNIRSEIRRIGRLPHRAGDLEHEDQRHSVVEEAIGTQMNERYEQALMSLGEQAREAVILRIELGYSYPEIAAATDSPSANAARMMVSRALVELAGLMQ